MKKFIKILFIACILFFLLSSCFKKIKSPLLDILPISLFQIQSGSMMPSIKIGEIVVVCKKPKYKENEIITYKTENNFYITHRIVKVLEDGYVTKGDFNNAEDETIIKKEQIKGKVIFHTILLGKVFQYRFYIIVILIFLLLL